MYVYDDEKFEISILIYVYVYDDEIFEISILIYMFSTDTTVSWALLENIVFDFLLRLKKSKFITVNNIRRHWIIREL